VLGAHGVRGQVRVRYFGDGPENILGAPRLTLAEPEGGIENPAAEEFEVEGGAAGRPGEVRLALRGVTDRDTAAGLTGWLVAGDPEHLPPLPEGEFYWYELIGCRVQASGGRTIGTVKEIWETGAHDVLVVEGEDGRSRLIPTARALMKEVDAETGRIVVEDLPGLFDPIREDAE
jgi:16S rRNA processing protein RimM